MAESIFFTWGGWLTAAVLLAAVAVLLLYNLGIRRQTVCSSLERKKLEFAGVTIDAVPLSILWFRPDGAIVMANQTALEVLGFTRDEILSMTMEKLDPQLGSEAIAELIAVLEKKSVLTSTGRLTDKSGRAFPVEQKMVLVENGGDRYVASINRDISMFILENRKKQEQEDALRRARDEAEAANRMKIEFIANMNHEVRTPMNAIIGYAEMLAASDLGEREQRFVTTIRKSGATLIALLNDIMELSKIESGRLKIHKQATSLKQLIDEVHDLFVDQLLAKKIEFVSTVQQDLPSMFMLDAMHCRQILVNLVSNGVKFTPAGRITLSVTGTVLKDDTYELHFSVADTGIGISKQEQQDILDLLDQYEPAAGMPGGKRLGLILCSRLALIMGGSLTLESEPDKGSTFILNLPATAAEDFSGTVLPPAPGHTAEQPGDREPVLLVVDDMAMISDIIRDYFARQPVRVIVATTSKEGLKLARTQHPDLILMDLNLAGIDGREAARLLKNSEETADIPVIVMTGRSLDPEDYLPDFEDLLAKPFHLDELDRIVSRYMRIPGSGDCPIPVPSPVSVPDQEEGAAFTCWTDELTGLLQAAFESGSLKNAAVLGECMHSVGVENECEQLMTLGTKLSEAAAALDIIGVEQILNFLTKQTDETP